MEHGVVKTAKQLRTEVDELTGTRAGGGSSKQLLDYVTVINNLQEQISRERAAHEQRLREITEKLEEKYRIQMQDRLREQTLQLQKEHNETSESDRQQLDAANDRCRSLEEDLRQLQNKYDMLAITSDTHADDASRARSDADHLAKRISQAAEGTEALRNQVQTLQSELETARANPAVAPSSGAMTARTQGAVETMEATVHRLAGVLREKENEINTLQQTVHRECMERHELQATIRELQAQIAQR